MPAFFPALPHALDADLRVVRADNPLANSITKLFGGHYDFIDGSRVENVIQGDRRIPVAHIGEQVPQQCLPRVFANVRFVDFSVLDRPFVEVVEAVLPVRLLSTKGAFARSRRPCNRVEYPAQAPRPPDPSSRFGSGSLSAWLRRASTVSVPSGKISTTVPSGRPIIALSPSCNRLSAGLKPLVRAIVSSSKSIWRYPVYAPPNHIRGLLAQQRIVLLGQHVELSRTKYDNHSFYHRLSHTPQTGERV